MDVSELQYYIFSGKPNSGTPEDLYQAVKEFWELEWNKVFLQIDPHFKIDTEDFARQTRITAVVHKGNIVGIQTLCDFQIDQIFSHQYFKPYTQDFIAGLISYGFKKFQVMQYFLVNEKYGVRATGLNIPALILGLNFRQQIHFGLPATVGLARKDVASASTAAKFNMLQVGADIEMHNVPVGQMLCLEPTRHPKNDVAQMIDSLWERRVDYSQIPDRTQNREIAAFS